MRVTRIEIWNFRSIQHLSVELGDTTVFVGPNNAGKTAILDAIRFALTRRWGQRGTGFTEYDIHLSTDNDDPKASEGVRIEIQAEEGHQNEWPESVAQDLGEIVQLDLATGIRSIILRVRCAWNTETAAFEPVWEFLNAKGEALGGGGTRRTNLERFWRYLAVFYLGALRDAKDEFSPRSQFWGRLLTALEIPAGLETRALRILDLLNRRIIDADPRLAEIARTLSSTTKIAARGHDGEVDLRMVPLKTWDLLSRAEIILRNESNTPWLPLRRQGQGIQSLSVIFLFRAFVDHLLAEFYESDSEPVLALEEPETHLHPQAARSLWTHIRDLPGQKIVTTHSPYFVQHAPFRDLRIVQLSSEGTRVRSLPANFAVRVPPLAGIADIAEKSSGQIEYAPASNTLTVNGALTESDYRKLLRLSGNRADRKAIGESLRRLRDQSSSYIDDSELEALETFARRMRGEIFFSRAWILVEGQADYLIVNAVATAMDFDLDEHGVSVIDTKNNGRPDTFAVLGRALGVPWLAVFDGDDAGNGYIKSIRVRGFNDAEIKGSCHTHPAGDLEQQLLADGLGPEARDALALLGVENAGALRNQEVLKYLHDNKTAYAAILAKRIVDSPSLLERCPSAFREAIDQLRELA